MKYVYVSLAIIAGFLLIKYTEWLVNNFGYNDWAEAKLGHYGGTRLLIKLIGLLFIVSALLVISGGMNVILYMIFKPLTGGFVSD